MTYDAENLLDMVLDCMVADGALNAKIAAVEAEKTSQGKGLTPALDSISDDAYFVQSWSNKILNKKVGVFYGIEDVTAEDGGGVVAKTYKVFVEVVVTSNNQKNDDYKRVLRYGRALEELFRAQFAPALGAGTVKIEQVRPIAMKLALDSDDEIKVGGVLLTVSLA